MKTTKDTTGISVLISWKMRVQVPIHLNALSQSFSLNHFVLLTLSCLMTADDEDPECTISQNSTHTIGANGNNDLFHSVVQVYMC